MLQAAGSVVVTSRIVAADATVASNAAAVMETTDSVAMSQALGVTVVSMQSPTTEDVLFAPPPTPLPGRPPSPPTQPPNQLNGDPDLGAGTFDSDLSAEDSSAVAGLTTGIVLLVCLAGVLIPFIIYRRNTASKLKAQHAAYLSAVQPPTTPAQPASQPSSMGGDQAFSGLVGKDPQAQQSYYRVPLPPDRKLSFTAEFSTSPAQTAGQI